MPRQRNHVFATYKCGARHGAKLIRRKIVTPQSVERAYERYLAERGDVQAESSV
jgi:hypothetical protein